MLTTMVTSPSCAKFSVEQLSVTPNHSLTRETENSVLGSLRKQASSSYFHFFFLNALLNHTEALLPLFGPLRSSERASCSGSLAAWHFTVSEFRIAECELQTLTSLFRPLSCNKLPPQIHQSANVQNARRNIKCKIIPQFKKSLQ